MANLSDAYGKVSIKTDANIKKFVDTFNNITNCWEYGIGIENFEEKIDDNTYVFSFWGTGRWTFENSLENLGESLDYEEKEAQLLIDSDWTLFFHFLDIEGGCEVLYTETAKIIHEKGKPLSECIFDVVESQSYNYDFLSYYNVVGEFDGVDVPEALMEQAKGEFIDWMDDKERNEEIIRIIDQMKKTKPFSENLDYYKNLLVA